MDSEADIYVEIGKTEKDGLKTSVKNWLTFEAEKVPTGWVVCRRTTNKRVQEHLRENLGETPLNQLTNKMNGKQHLIYKNFSNHFMSLVTTLSEKLKIAPLPPDEQRAIMADLEVLLRPISLRQF